MGNFNGIKIISGLHHGLPYAACNLNIDSWRKVEVSSGIYTASTKLIELLHASLLQIARVETEKKTVKI